MSALQQTELHRIYYGCRLGSREIDQLFSIACQGISEYGISVSTLIGETRFTSSSLASLVASVNEAHIPDSQKLWDSTSLDALDESTGRTLKITLDSDRVEFSVSGADPTWAHGQTARLEEYLLGCNGDKEGGRGYGISNLVVSLLLVGMAGWLVHSIHAEANQSLRERIIECREAYDPNSWSGKYAVPGYVALIVWIVTQNIYMWTTARINRGLILVDGVIPTGSWWSRLSTNEKCVVIGVPIAFIGAVGAVFSAAADLLG